MSKQQYKVIDWGAVDIGFHGSNITPLNGEGCVGKGGIDKNYTFFQVLEIAKKNNANIIIKAGKNAKWYIKKCKKDQIPAKIKSQEWRDTSRNRMYEIEWL
tara:strand:- start:167 stop:469 length:303 start_codon:yes stop_codon:yes gene_type:complete